MKNLSGLENFVNVLPWVGLVLFSFLTLILLLRITLRVMYWKGLLHRKMVFLELTPPAFTTRTPEANERLFSVLHGLGSVRSLKDRILGRRTVITPEMASSRETGVRYIVHVEEHLAPSLQQIITSYLPDVKVAVVPEFFPESTDKTQLLEFKQTGHYAFPLISQFSLEEHDPVAYLTGAMSKLAPGEFISFQLVLTPVRLREAAILSHKILGNEDLLTHLSGKKVPVWSALARAINTVLFGLLDLVGSAYHTPTKNSYSRSQMDAHNQLQIAKRLKPARTLSMFEQELVQSIHSKVSQDLFRVSIRASVSMSDENRTRERLGAIKSALASYGVPSYQALKPKIRLPFMEKYRRLVYQNRLPALLPKRDSVLSIAEVANMYHFPTGETSKTDNLVTSLSRTLAAPLSLKQGTKFDVILGQNLHHGTETPIGLTDKERERHIYIIGGTGNGKTTMLQYGIIQDMQNGKGLAVVDPHGDMAETLLRHVPEDRIEDVIYFHPDDLEHPIGLNLLELTPGLTGKELLREKDLITESVVSVFRKIFSEDDSGGHRIEYVLRNTIQTALTVEGATLFTVFDLLNDPKYRRVVIKSLESEDLKNFWNNELGKAGEMQRVKMAAGITAKIGRFLFSASAKQILEQPKSTIDFDDIINTGKILICNFSKGLLGEDTSELFGITILAKLQLASLRRARIQQSERKPFYLYVDEFQNFATASFVQMLSESRKYKLLMVMAEQSTSQQKDQQMVNIILANVGTVISFRTGNPSDERLLLPLFSPYINEGEIANLAAFNFYVRLSAMLSQEPLSGQTILLANEGSIDVAERVVEESKGKYGLREELISPKTIEPVVIKSKATRKKNKVNSDVNKVGRVQDMKPTT